MRIYHQCPFRFSSCLFGGDGSGLGFLNDCFWTSLTTKKGRTQTNKLNGRSSRRDIITFKKKKRRKCSSSHFNVKNWVFTQKWIKSSFVLQRMDYWGCFFISFQFWIMAISLVDMLLLLLSSHWTQIHSRCQLLHLSLHFLRTGGWASNWFLFIFKTLKKKNTTRHHMSATS